MKTRRENDRKLSNTLPKNPMKTSDNTFVFNISYGGPKAHISDN